MYFYSSLCCFSEYKSKVEVCVFKISKHLYSVVSVSFLSTETTEKGTLFFVLFVLFCSTFTSSKNQITMSFLLHFNLKISSLFLKKTIII
ncbi:hypothetical protein B0A68_12270 [Flavobacterium reichenbachii]|nr:hypothetical protein B0A68_12270 [Flavobacterium reichenbachii]